MIVFFIAISGFIIQCVGARWCEVIDSVLFHHMWEAGIVELMFELPAVGLKIYRRKEDKIAKDKEISSDK